MDRIAKKNSLLLYCTMFTMGSTGIAYEYTLSKVASDLLGNSTRQWALTIGFMMFFMGMGANYQKKISQKNLFILFVVLENLQALIGSFAPLLLLLTYGFWYNHYTLIQYGIIALLGFLIGLEIPIITRINEPFTPKLKVNLGRTLQMDYLGALSGALIWSFLLLPYFSLSRSAFILGLSSITVTLLFQTYFYKRIPRPRRLLLLSGLNGILLIIGCYYSPDWNIRAEQALYRDQIVYSKTTPYQHLILTRRNPLSPETSAEYRLYINGNLQFNSADEYIYHENLVHPAFALASRPQRILILGGGDGLALREVLKYRSVREVVLCDLDPEMLSFASTHPVMRRLNRDSLRDWRLQAVFSAEDFLQTEAVQIRQDNPHSLRQSAETMPLSPLIRIVSLDAMKFIRQVEGRFDVIIADFPDPSSENLSKLYSLPFYHAVRTRLNPSGIFVQQSTSPTYSRKAFLSIGRTIQAAGLETAAYRDIIPSFGPWGWWIARPPAGDRKSLLAELRQIRLADVPRRHLDDTLSRANAVFPPPFVHQLSQSELNHPDFYRDWVNSLTESKIFRYYQQSTW